MSCKNGARSVSDYSDSKRKGSASLLSTISNSSKSSSTKPKSITAYDVDFDDILEAHRILEADDEEPSNWKELQQLVGRERASAPPEEHEIKGIRVTVQRSSNEDSVAFSVFPRIFPVSRVNTCHTLKEHWNRQWTHWIPSYQNQDPKVAPPQPDYAIGYHTRLFPGGTMRRLLGFASPSKNKLSFPIFFAELKGASGSMNVAKLQNKHNGASAVHNILRLHQAIGLEDGFFNKAWVLSLDTNGEMWRLRCHWVSKGDLGCHTYYSKVLRCWAIEDPRDAIISEARASMRNLVDQMREVLFHDIFTVVDIYERTLNREALESKFRQTSKNVRPEPADSTVHLASNDPCVNDTHSVGFGAQLNAAYGSREFFKTDNGSVRESIESEQPDTSTITQESSLSNAINDENSIGTDKGK